MTTTLGTFDPLQRGRDFLQMTREQRGARSITGHVRPLIAPAPAPVLVEREAWETAIHAWLGQIAQDIAPALLEAISKTLPGANVLVSTTWERSPRSPDVESPQLDIAIWQRGAPVLSYSLIADLADASPQLWLGVKTAAGSVHEEPFAPFLASGGLLRGVMPADVAEDLLARLRAALTPIIAS